MSLVFFSVGATGPGSAFEQILRFSAVRTDWNLDELESVDLRCRLLPHVIASPGVVHAAGYTVDELTDISVPTHYQMVRSVRDQLLKWTPATFIGYNSIACDEHLLRHALYQTLHHPYLTNSDRNTRSDVMRITQAAAIFSPGALTIPKDDQGLLRFALPELAAANGFKGSAISGTSSSVRAMMFLARLLMDNASEAWSSAMRFSKKATVTDFVENETVFALADFYFDKPQSWLVTALGADVSIRTDYYVYNLAVDPDELIKLDDEELASRLEAQPKPVRILKINAAPILTSATDAMGAARGSNLGLQELERRADVVRTDRDFCDRLMRAMAGKRKEKASSPYVEEQIYDSFTSNEDLRLLADIHRIPWHKRPAVIDNLQDERLKTLGRQLMYFEQPDLLSAASRLKYDREFAQKLAYPAGDVPWLSIHHAIEEIDSLLAGLPKRRSEKLQAYRSYLTRRLGEAKSRC